MKALCNKGSIMLEPFILDIFHIITYPDIFNSSFDALPVYYSYLL